jgi:outer membrane protein insertion porin family
MNRRIRTTVRTTLLGSLLLAAPLARAQAVAPPEGGPVVEHVDVQGNQYLQKETFLFYVSTKAGDRYDERRLKDDFRRLWDTGLVDDMVLNVFDGRQGKVVVFQIRERRRIQIVDYRGSKLLTTSAIEDKLKEKEAALKVDNLYDPAKARRVEAIIKEMLVEKGRPFATVKHDAKNVGPSGVQVSFVIDEGAKAKVKQIDFVGNHVFSDGYLRGQMKRIKQVGNPDMWSFFSGPVRWGKTTYSEDRWAEPEKGDRSRLQNFYLNHGYVTATVGEPRISYLEGTSGSKKKPVRWVRLEIPISEGEQYKVGEIKFEGLSVFKEEHVRPVFKFKEGDVYKESRIQKGYDKLRDAYGAQGYFQWTALTKRDPDPVRKVVDLTLAMEEDKKYYVGQIRFTGNDTTRDKVIRREVYINEGDIFNTEALKLSIRRINQLGYFKPMEKPPQIMPSAKGEDKLDLIFKVEEQNRNQFTFGGGVSGLEGKFVNASFSTANFLGLGETLQLSAQTGRRTKNYQLAITEPYLFDRAITAGIDLFSRKIIYDTVLNVVGFTQEETGGSLVSGLQVGHFSRLFGNYTYQTVNIQALEQTSFSTTILPPSGITDSFVPTTPITNVNAPTFDPLALGLTKIRESTFTPSYVFNSVDNPWTPHSGYKITLTPQVAGGILGGSLSYLRPEAEVVAYFPFSRRTALGVRGQISYIRPYGSTPQLPLYKRFFLGGENEIRGTNIRTVGPVDEQNRAIGGNKSILFNAEYYFDIAGPLRALLFFDAGQAYKDGDPIDPRQFRTSTGVEVRFIMPVINVPFRLIYALNPNRDSFQPARTFKFAVGTTF